MSNKINQWLRLLPYLLVGTFVFISNSQTDLNYFLRGYLVLLESSFGLVLIYFLVAKIINRNKRKIPKVTSS
ncbi:hypothetical protein [Gloeothece verrucosa]|uniref:Uncharacterized protein n=1 Tax=Gloeothece verrucosa (strain PCC 7822) TaxID=497965 RepID=E0U8U9_GLOV7|nr:hypothetical protein [Gloeothece verrucosa]ADN14963.1 conserved hypothetical protein [Gloeothece verrucosa PCC 7822]